MRDLFEPHPADDPIEAARRTARPGLRRRFYEKAAIANSPDGHVVALDGKPIHTPGRRLLAAPTFALAEAVAAEWNAQLQVIDPAKMPLTRLANSIIDGVSENTHAVADEVAKYLASDLLFYRAGAPPGLVERQTRHWTPILVWAETEFGVRFVLAEGVVYVTQSKETLAAIRKAIPEDFWRIGAVHVITTLTGSALIALALLRGGLSAEAAWQAAHVDEDWNMEQWGRDKMAMQRREYRFAEFQAAVTVLKNLPA